MDGWEWVIGIINAVLLVAIAVKLFLDKKRSDKNKAVDAAIDRVIALFNQSATEQFRRFGMIQESLQSALQASREETNRQLRVLGDQLDARIKSLQESNEKRLEQMQGIVDEKLQATLDARIKQSFEQVSEQLNNVQQGLGEVKNIAEDARSLKNALVNVKERGTYGEVRLEKLLSDILAPSQYVVNVEISGGKRVEFAVKLPGHGDTPLLLPIDSKFPIENYNRLLDAEDKQAIDEARKALAQQMRVFAKDIHDKYILPPKTTDFALMFLPTEGLYAEVVQNATLFEELRDRFKVTPIGVTTLSAFLASLQLGFKTLAIEQKSQDVWSTLQKVKQEVGKFGVFVKKVHDDIKKADKTLVDFTSTRLNAIERSLRNVETLDTKIVPLFLDLPEADDE
jgi:DNA recombination protein RmuC